MKKLAWDDYWANYPGPSRAETWLIRQRDEVLRHWLATLTKGKKRVLEVGCGFASNSRLLGLDPDLEVHCLDSSPQVIAQLTSEIDYGHWGDAQDMPLADDYFDLVFSAGLLEHYPDPAPLLAEMQRVLRGKGLLISFVPGRYSLWQVYRKLHGKNWQHGYEENYTPAKLRKILGKSNLEILDIKGIDPWSVNGILMKLFNRRLPLERSFHPSGYTEIYAVALKI